MEAKDEEMGNGSELLHTTVHFNCIEKKMEHPFRIVENKGVDLRQKYDQNNTILC